MNVELLRELGLNASEWARTYVNLVEALVMEGVPEEIARREAREAATIAAFAEAPLCDEEHEEGDWREP